MSPIGRVFIVINLILAGAFVVMAGTFLQKHTDWKAKYDGQVKELEVASQSSEATRLELTGQVNNLDRELRANTSSLETSKNDNSRLTDENQRLKDQLADLASDIKTLTSQGASMDAAINEATKQSQQAYTMAMEANAAKDEALDEKEKADTALSNANRQIADLENRLAEGLASVALLEQGNSEKDVLIAYISTKFPGALALAQPDLRGVVEQASGNICTVRVTTNPGEAAVKPGYTMAIYKGNTYKGEAVITEVDGEFAFCRVTKPVSGLTVAAGDNASTNVGF